MGTIQSGQATAPPASSKSWKVPPEWRLLWQGEEIVRRQQTRLLILMLIVSFLVVWENVCVFMGGPPNYDILPTLGIGVLMNNTVSLQILCGRAYLADQVVHSE